MTDLQKQLLRQHEIRSRMREIAAGEQTDETKSETATLLSELGAVEQRATALQVAEDLDPNRGETETDGAGDPALARLVEQATVGEVLTASIEHRATAGATRELQEHYGMAGNMVPLDLLMGGGGAGIEHRTTGVTPGGTETGAAQRPIVPAVFPASAASYLGINPEMVPTGDAVWPVLSTSASPGTPAKGAEQAHSTGAFTVAVLSPKRIQASLFFGLEDQARFAGMEEALRLNLSDALADQLDDEVLNGADGGCSSARSWTTTTRARRTTTRAIESVSSSTGSTASMRPWPAICACWSGPIRTATWRQATGATTTTRTHSAL